MPASRLPDIAFLTEDHPEANGRVPSAGDIAYEFRFPLENGRILALRMGIIGFVALREVIHGLTAEEAVDDVFPAPDGGPAWP